jgi:hypothetical protein
MKYLLITRRQFRDLPANIDLTCKLASQCCQTKSMSAHPLAFVNSLVKGKKPSNFFNLSIESFVNSLIIPFSIVLRQ